MKIILSFILITLLSAPLYAGDERGNGADTNESHIGSAWFPGNQKVSYCIQKSNNFSKLNDSAIQESISQSLKTWNQYIETKKINKSSFFTISYLY